jgi:hypothetical protein
MRLRQQGRATLDRLVRIQQELGAEGIEWSLMRIFDAVLWVRAAELELHSRRGLKADCVHVGQQLRL